MFGGLNKIVDRSFVVGFAMPALIFFFGSAGILRVFGYALPYLDLTGSEPLKDTTVLALLSLAGSFLLMIFNWNILRVMEGYWYWGLGRKVNHLFARRWKTLSERIAALDKEYEEWQS